LIILWIWINGCWSFRSEWSSSKFAVTQRSTPGRRLAAGASFGLRIVFVDSAKYVFLPSGRPSTPCVMLRSAVNYEDNFESCVCVLHITSFRLREFLPCKPICFKPTAQPPRRHCRCRRRHRHPRAASTYQPSVHLPISTIVIRQTDLNENLRLGVPEKPSILSLNPLAFARWNSTKRMSNPGWRCAEFMIVLSEL